MAGISNEVIDLNAAGEGGGGSRVRVPAGDYKAKIKKVEYKTSGSGNPMFVWTFVGTEGKLKGKELTEYTVLKANSYWKLRDLIEAATGKIPKAAATRVLLEWCKKNVVGSEMGVTVGDDEYTNDKGKVTISSKISDYMSLDDLSGEAPEDDVEDEDADVEEEETEEEEEGEDSLAALDRKELKALVKEQELDVKVLKSMSDDELRAAIHSAQGDDEDEEEEIEDVDLDDL